MFIPPMPSLLLLHVVLTSTLIGLVWTVQVVVYPSFEGVGRSGFSAWHVAYTTRIGRLVGPLMLAEAGSALWLLWQGLSTPAFAISLALLAIIWLSTSLIQMPLHRRLTLGFDPLAHRVLVRSNWLRTAAWTSRGICLLACL